MTVKNRLSKDAQHTRSTEANLGQKKAEKEKASESRLRHMGKHEKALSNQPEEKRKSK